jgi:hypothetical protein
VVHKAAKRSKRVTGFALEDVVSVDGESDLANCRRKIFPVFRFKILTWPF